MCDIGAFLQDPKDLRSEIRILAGELEGERRKDSLKIAAVLEVSRAEEASTELPVHKGRLGECLGDGGFPGPGQAVQPENTLGPLAREPVFNVLEDTLPCTPQAPLPIPTAVPGIYGVVQSLEKDEVGRFLSIG